MKTNGGELTPFQRAKPVKSTASVPEVSLVIRDEPPLVKMLIDCSGEGEEGGGGGGNGRTSISRSSIPKLVIRVACGGGGKGAMRRPVYGRGNETRNLAVFEILRKGKSPYRACARARACKLLTR